MALLGNILKVLFTSSSILQIFCMTKPTLTTIKSFHFQKLCRTLNSITFCSCKFFLFHIWQHVKYPPQWLFLLMNSFVLSIEKKAGWNFCRKLVKILRVCKRRVGKWKGIKYSLCLGRIIFYVMVVALVGVTNFGRRLCNGEGSHLH